MSALLATATPRHIKAEHLRRRKRTTGHRVYANNNPYTNIDPDGRQTGSHLEFQGFSGSNVDSLQVSAQAEMVKSSAGAEMRGLLKNVEVKGLLAGDVEGKISAEYSNGSGIRVTKGLGGAKDEIGLVTPAYGRQVSGSTTLISIGYRDSSPDAPVSIDSGFRFSFYRGYGGELSASWSPPMNFQASIDIGLGVGTAWNVYGVNYQTIDSEHK